MNNMEEPLQLQYCTWHWQVAIYAKDRSNRERQIDQTNKINGGVCNSIFSRPDSQSLLPAPLADEGFWLAIIVEGPGVTMPVTSATPTYSAMCTHILLENLSLTSRG